MVANKYELGKYEDSYELCQWGLKVFPRNALMSYVMGVYYAKNLDYSNAIRNIENALNLGYPESKVTITQLGKLYKMTGNEKRAEILFKEAEKIK